MRPTSLRIPEAVKERLDKTAARSREKPSSVAVRLIDEGLRMAEHPGVTFHDSPAHGRVAALAPDRYALGHRTLGPQDRHPGRQPATRTLAAVTWAGLRCTYTLQVERAPRGEIVDRAIIFRWHQGEPGDLPFRRT